MKQRRPEASETPAARRFLSGGGATGATIRALDWASTDLGAPEQWPEALRTLVAVILGSNQPMFVAWGPGRTLIYNDAYATLLMGKDPAALGRDFLEVWDEARPALAPIVARALGGEPVQMDHSAFTVNRRGFPEEAHFSFFYSPVRAEDGTVSGFFCACSEITGQILAERRAAAERERQRRMLQQMPGFAALLEGPDHRYAYVNDAYVAISGQREFVGRTVRDVFPELAGQGFYELLDQVFQGGEPYAARAMPIRLSGEQDERFIDFLYHPVRDETGGVTGLFVGGYEVTEQVRAERRLRASEARFRAVQETSIDGFMVLETIRDARGAIEDFRWIYANESAARIVGRTRDWFAGRRLLEEMPGNRADGLFDAYREVVDSGRPWSSEITYRHEGLDVHIRIAAAKVGDGFAVSFADLSERRRAEQAVRDSEERLRLAFTAGGLAAWSWDVEADRFERAAMGGSPDEDRRVPGRLQDFLDRVHPEDRAGVERALRGAAAGGGDHVAEFRTIDPSGAVRWFASRGQVNRTSDGSALRLAGYDADITERKAAEDRLRASEEAARAAASLLEHIIETAPDPIWTKDADGRFSLVNTAAARVLGQPREALVGLQDRDLFPPETSGVLAEEQTRILGAGETLMVEEVLYDAARGEDRTFLSTKVPLRADGGEVTGWLGLARDVTELKRVEARLAEEAERVQLALDAGAIVGTWVWEVPADRFVADERFAHAFGIDAEECRSGLALDKVMASIHADDRSRVSEAIAHSLAQGGPYRCEYRVRHADGSLHWVEASGRVELSPEGRALRFPGVLLDVGERRAAEQERDQATELLRSFIEAVPGVVYAKDRAGRMLLANRGATELIGKPPEVYLGRTDAEFLDDKAQAAAIMATDQRIMGAGRSEQVEEEVRLANGEPAVWLSTKSPLRDAGGEVTGLIGTSIDITARKRTEAALRESQERLAELNETLERRVAEAIAERDRVWRNSRDLLAVVGADGIFHAVSPSWEQVLGHRPEDIVGRSLEAFVWPADQVRTQAALGQAAAGERLSDFENRYRHADGDWRWISWRTAMENGLVYAYGRDVTAEKARQAELRQAQEALRQSQKLESMGQLTGGVAHDFNNLLMPIIAGLDMLQRRTPGDERTQRLIDGALKSAERAKTLVQRLLAFARRQPLQPTAVDLRALVEGMADLVASTSGPRVRVITEAPDGLPPVRADANQVEMAILNLAVNARDAMPDGGQLTVSAREAAPDEAPPEGLAQGRYVRLSVSDTGTGMDEAVLRRAVEPFFSTKGVGKGTGLGLSMVHGLVGQLKGGLTIRSRLGVGTTVELWLPVAEGAAPRAAEEASPDLAGAGLVLLVDDEELVRSSTADMLAELGYAVTLAESGEAALRMLEEGLCPDFLVTDHLMPGITGTELARAVRERRPHTRVLIVSGYAEDEGVAPDLPRLTKPFRQAELSAKLGELA